MMLGVDDVNAVDDVVDVDVDVDTGTLVVGMGGFWVAGRIPP